MDFLRLYQHLLPDGRAWSTTVNKRLRQLFQGLATAPEGAKDAADSVWADLTPSTTDKLGAWEKQFGLPSSVTDENDRRERLLATWRALAGGQSPQYIQDTLQAAGFDVYVHEWWEDSTPPTPGVRVDPVARNPLLYIRKTAEQTPYQVTCGNPAATCGNPAATCGSTLNPGGYPLVNKITQPVESLTVTCGNPAATCGNPAATCGNFNTYKEERKEYDVPTDRDRWPYFLYIGGEAFPSFADVPEARRDEFETLCLKICPAQQWLGAMVKYT